MHQELTLYGKSPQDGSLQAIVLEEESIQKILQIELEDRLKGKIRSWRKAGSVQDSKVYGALYGLEISSNSRYEGFAQKVLYPLAERILGKNSFVKEEGIWSYRKE